MTLQGELVEPEPSRTLHGGIYGWGVDSSTLAVNIGWARCDGEELERGVQGFGFPKERDLARRGARIYAECVRAGAMVANTGWPRLVWFEQPSGQSPNPPLVYAVGQIIAGLYAGLWSVADGRPMPDFESIESARWKKRAIGPGWHLLKKDKGDLLRLAREQFGYDGTDPNDADAVLIAEALRRTVRLKP